MRIIQNIAVSVLGLMTALAILELAVRAFAPSPPLMYRPDVLLGWAHTPWTSYSYPVRETGRVVEVRINSRGLRDREVAYEKAPGVFRVLVLGDSFTEGPHVDLADTYPKRLERLLEGAGQRAEVINAGVGGYSTDQELLFLMREGGSNIARTSSSWDSIPVTTCTRT